MVCYDFKQSDWGIVFSCTGTSCYKAFNQTLSLDVGLVSETTYLSGVGKGLLNEAELVKSVHIHDDLKIRI